MSEYLLRVRRDRDLVVHLGSCRHARAVLTQSGNDYASGGAELLDDPMAYAAGCCKPDRWLRTHLTEDELSALSSAISLLETFLEDEGATEYLATLRRVCHKVQEVMT